MQKLFFKLFFMFSHYYFFVPNSNFTKEGRVNIYKHISYIIIYVYICYIRNYIYALFSVTVQIVESRLIGGRKFLLG